MTSRISSSRSWTGTRFPRALLKHDHLAESHHLSIPVRRLANDNHCFVFPVYGSNVQDADEDQAIRLSFRRKLVGTKGDGDLNRLLCRCLWNRLDECLQIVVDAEPRISTKTKAEGVGRSVLLQELKQQGKGRRHDANRECPVLHHSHQLSIDNNVHLQCGEAGGFICVFHCPQD